MNKVLFIIIPLLFLGIVGIIFWSASRYPQETPQAPKIVNQTGDTSSESKSEESVPEAPVSETLDASNTDAEGFPPPSTEIKNGKVERTIHMGVRQYAWDPSVITVKKGELVRLVIHNADVKHGLVIPDLGIMEGDIPPEGAVIEFTPDKVGTFEFFCSVWCGEGHMEMRGKIIVE